MKRRPKSPGSEGRLRHPAGPRPNGRVTRGHLGWKGDQTRRNPSFVANLRSSATDHGQRDSAAFCVEKVCRGCRDCCDMSCDSHFQRLLIKMAPGDTTVGSRPTWGRIGKPPRAGPMPPARGPLLSYAKMLTGGQWRVARRPAQPMRRPIPEQDCLPPQRRRVDWLSAAVPKAVDREETKERQSPKPRSVPSSAPPDVQQRTQERPSLPHR